MSKPDEVVELRDRVVKLEQRLNQLIVAIYAKEPVASEAEYLNRLHFAVVDATDSGSPTDPSGRGPADRS